VSAITERQWLPDPPPPWFWELHDGTWWLAHQDQHEGLIVAGTCDRRVIGDADVLAMITSTIEHLPPTWIAKSHGA
jgi:hypothetical protein